MFVVSLTSFPADWRVADSLTEALCYLHAQPAGVTKRVRLEPRSG